MDLNKVLLIGNVGKEPTFHSMTDGKELAKFSVATTRKWKDKRTGEMRENTAWHNIVVFNPYLVEVVQKWVQKGSQVYIEGEVVTRSYEKDGEKKYITEILIPQVKGELFVLARGRGWDTNETPGSERRRGSEPSYPQQAGDVARGGFDDDIPF